MNTLLFVYGTLKRGYCNHQHLAGQTFVGLARTQPGYRLVDMGGYPGITPLVTDVEGVTGEIWSVAPDALERLDRFEGVHEGLYRREAIPLKGAFENETVFAYIPGISVTGRRDIGSTWIEEPN
jgi:gamma-glutamylaminecyclotransferase